jgi:DNA polymerase-3 subunit delta
MILLISGEEVFLSQKKLSQIKEKFLSENQEMEEILEFDEKNFNVSEFSQKALTIPFFEEKKVILIKNISKIKLSDRDAEKLLLDIEKIPESTIVIFLEEDKLDEKNNILKALKDTAKKTWDFKKMDNRGLLLWAKKEIETRGSQIEDAALTKLISAVENDVWQLYGEIEKLTLYKLKKKIGEKDIDNLVQANINANIFKLIDKIGEKDKKNSLAELTKLLKKGEDPVYLLGMLVYQLRNMLIVKEMASKGMSKSEIVRETKKHPFVIEKALRQVRNFSSEELEKIFNKLFDSEIKIKRGKTKPDIELSIFIVTMCS